MMMQTETLDKIQSMLRTSNSLGGFFASYKSKIGGNCDKHGAGFNADSRFSSFQLSLSFDSWLGYYGNSGCSTALGNIDSKLASEYFVKAINIHKETLFATAAQLMRAEADKLTVKAREEIAALQAMVDAVSADAEQSQAA